MKYRKVIKVCNDCGLEVVEDLYCENSECSSYGEYNVKDVECESEDEEYAI